MRGPHPQSVMAFRYRGHVTNKNVISPLSQGLWIPHLVNQRLRMRRHHPQSHVTLQYRGHVINRKRYISTFARSMDPRLSWVVTQDERTSPTKSRRSRGHVSSQNVLSPHSQGPRPPKRGSVLNQNERTPPKRSRDTSNIFPHIS